MLALARSHGLRPSVAYDEDGLSHDNCAGACVRGGKAHWAQVRRRRPGVFRYALEQEAALRALLGDYSMLKETRNKTRRYLPLAEFDARLRVQELTADEALDVGGCGCGADTDDDEPFVVASGEPTTQARIGVRESRAVDGAEQRETT